MTSVLRKALPVACLGISSSYAYSAPNGAADTRVSKVAYPALGGNSDQANCVCKFLKEIQTPLSSLEKLPSERAFRVVLDKFCALEEYTPNRPIACELNLVLASTQEHPVLQGLTCVRFIVEKTGDLCVHLICNAEQKQRLINACFRQEIVIANPSSGLPATNPALECSRIPRASYQYGPNEAAVFHIRDKRGVQKLLTILEKDIPPKHLDFLQIFGLNPTIFSIFCRNTNL